METLAPAWLHRRIGVETHDSTQSTDLTDRFLVELDGPRPREISVLVLGGAVR